MFCPKCKNRLSERKNHCEHCGEEITRYRKIVMASNLFYNRGLEKAKVRDLTGAVNDLLNSLKLYKKNTNARNLLGLVYYEQGEVVDALSEWVLSKHYQQEENDAEIYINAVQNNPTKLDSVNQAVKKYNGALSAAKQGNTDLAVIQLKKVVSLNPKFIRAFQLLALLYIGSGEMDKAVKYLLKASKIDVNNTTTLRYLREAGTGGQSKTGQIPDNVKKDSERKVYKAETDMIVPISTYKEEKPNIIAYVNLVIGIIIGLAVILLAVPAIKKGIREEYRNETVNYSDQLSAQTAAVATLEGDKKELQEKVTKLEKEIADMSVGEYDAAQYDGLFEAITLYLDGDKTGAAAKLANTKNTKMESKTALELYDRIKEETFKKASEDLYSQGYKDYSSGKYETAITSLEKAVAMDETNVNAVYFMGRSYHRLGQNEKAASYYHQVIDKFPDSSRAAEAKNRLKDVE